MMDVMFCDDERFDVLCFLIDVWCVVNGLMCFGVCVGLLVCWFDFGCVNGDVG